MPMGLYGPVPGIVLTWFLAPRLLDLGCDNARLDRGGNAPGDLVLEGKDIGQFAIVAIRPQVVTSRRLDQLCGDAETIGGPPHAAFEHVAHAELATDFAYVCSRTLVSKGGAARDHKKCMVVRQVGDDVLGDALREILLFGGPAHTRKGNTAIDGFCGSGRADRVVVSAAAITSLAGVSNRTRWIGTGRAMFLTWCSPMSSNEKCSLSRTSSRTMRLTQIPPGSARASRRAAMLTPSP